MNTDLDAAKTDIDVAMRRTSDMKVKMMQHMEQMQDSGELIYSNI